MEACASSHYWGREFNKLGHEVRLIPPIYVKPFVKRQKNDANDAEAVAEAVVRPTMRFVPVKSEEQQARSMIFKTRDLLVRQRNALINALRGHLMEYGIIAPAGRTFVKRLEGRSRIQRATCHRGSSSFVTCTLSRLAFSTTGSEKYRNA